MKKRAISNVTLIALALLLVAAVPAPAAETRAAVGTAFTYQGRLTDGAVGANGSYDLQFSLWDADAGGSQLGSTIEQTGVTVTDGLVTAELDFGDVVGASALWLEVAVRATGSPSYTTLSPRQRLTPGPQGLWAANASALETHPASYFLDTSASSQTKSGRLTVNSASGYGVTGSGPDGGGYFSDSNGSGYARTGTGNTGIVAQGSGAGGGFADTDSTSLAMVAYGDLGIDAEGTRAGGYFHDSNNTGTAYVGYGNRGISAWGTGSGGAFSDSDGSGYAEVAVGDIGIDAEGSEAGGYFHTGASGAAHLAYGNYGISASGFDGGGHFFNTDGSSEAYVGAPDYGITGSGTEAGAHFSDSSSTGDAYVGYGALGISAQGSEAGGYFHDSNSSGLAHVGYGDLGISAEGSEAGGYFHDSSGTSEAYVGHGDYGVTGSGTAAGGHFLDNTSSGDAYVGYGNLGISAEGSQAGGYFADSDGTSEAYVGYFDRGISAEGSSMGGSFHDTTSGASAQAASGLYAITGQASSGAEFYSNATSSWNRIAHDTYKVFGNGTVDFVQNHPEDPGKVIAYSAPEGDEVAVYTRGSARLSGGEATVPLGQTFRWVTDPDIGLTAYVTAREPGCTLYVPEIATDSLTVRSSEGSDCTFDYIVWGLRIGFEDVTVVQPKPREAYIPSMNHHREMVAAEPELARYTARSRYLAQRSALGYKSAPDTSRSQALIAAIHEFDPAVDRTEGPERPELPKRPDHSAASAAPPTARPVARTGEARSNTALAPVREPLAVGVSADRDLDARSFRSQLGRVATRVAVDGPVQPGDVLAIDRDRPELLKRAAASGDPTVVGIVVDTAGVTLGEGEVAKEQAHALLATPGAIVPCRVDAGYGAIAPGDLLVSSPTPGRAMRASDPLPGSVVAKALQPLADGEGTIRVLVMLR